MCDVTERNMTVAHCCMSHSKKINLHPYTCHTFRTPTLKCPFTPLSCACQHTCSHSTVVSKEGVAKISYDPNTATWPPSFIAGPLRFLSYSVKTLSDQPVLWRCQCRRSSPRDQKAVTRHEPNGATCPMSTNENFFTNKTKTLLFCIFVSHLEDLIGG